MSETAPGYTADGVEFVGYHDVGGKPIFKLAMQVVGEKWYLYASHFWEPRLSIFDVSEPAEPRLVDAIEGPEPAATWQVQVADGLLVQGMEHRPPAWGGDPELNSAEGIRLLRRQRSDRAEAIERVAHRRPRGAPQPLHRWPLRTRDCESPRVRRQHLRDPRHRRSAATRGSRDVVSSRAVRRRPSSIPPPVAPHLAGSPCMDRPTCSVIARTSATELPGVVILDISDIERPTLVSRLDIGAAFSSMIAMHTVIPVPSRNLLLVNTEAIAERQQEAYNFAGIVDISDEPQPASHVAASDSAAGGGRDVSELQHAWWPVRPAQSASSSGA